MLRLVLFCREGPLVGGLRKVVPRLRINNSVLPKLSQRATYVSTRVCRRLGSTFTLNGFRQLVRCSNFLCLFLLTLLFQTLMLPPSRLSSLLFGFALRSNPGLL